MTSVSDQIDPRAKFVVAGFNGETTYEQRARSLIQKSDRCSKLSFDRQPVHLLNAADVIVAPFISPHSARSVFEGAATGKPAIVSDLPNLTELILAGQTGFAFQFDQKASFVTAVNELCDQHKRTKFGSAALQFAKENFIQDTNVQKTIDIYRNLMVTT